MKAHPFFANIDFEQLLLKELRPPFMPEIKHGVEKCICNFEEEFTKMPIAASPTN